MATEEIIDFTDDDAEGIERGGTIPDGWYHVMVKDVYEDRKGGNGALVFEYQILHGKLAGQVLFDRLFDPELSQTDSAKRFALQHKKLVAKRLGLVSEFGAPRPVNWMDAPGRECYVQVKTRKYEDKKTGELKSATGIAFDGVYPLDDPRVPSEVRDAGDEVPPSPFDGPAAPSSASQTKTLPSATQARAASTASTATASKPARQARSANLDDISV